MTYNLSVLFLTLLLQTQCSGSSELSRLLLHLQLFLLAWLVSYILAMLLKAFCLHKCH